jgi:hypothetical protein
MQGYNAQAVVTTTGQIIVTAEVGTAAGTTDGGTDPPTRCRGRLHAMGTFDGHNRGEMTASSGDSVAASGEKQIAIDNRRVQRETERAPAQKLRLCALESDSDAPNQGRSEQPQNPRTHA